jgi:hypothetical protein
MEELLLKGEEDTHGDIASNVLSNLQKQSHAMKYQRLGNAKTQPTMRTPSNKPQP